jgi:hypothetical protein
MVSMSVLNALGHWFIEPQRKVTQEEERKQAKLLSLLLLFVLFIDLAYLAGTLLFSSSQYHAGYCRLILSAVRNGMKRPFTSLLSALAGQSSKVSISRPIVIP